MLFLSVVWLLTFVFGIVIFPLSLVLSGARLRTETYVCHYKYDDDNLPFAGKVTPPERYNPK